SMSLRSALTRHKLHAGVVLAYALGLSAPSSAQRCTVLPPQVKLGQTLRISCPALYSKAKLNDRETHLFLHPTGSGFGLLPISLKDKPGVYDFVASRSDDGRPQVLRVTIRKTLFPSQNVKLSPDIEALHSTPDEMALLKSFKENISNDRFWLDPL